MLKYLFKVIFDGSLFRKGSRRSTPERPFSLEDPEHRKSLAEIQAHVDRQEHSAAMVKMEEHLRIYPVTADFLASLGALHKYLGEYPECKDALLKALELDPAHVAALNNLALLEFSQANYKDADRYYREALSHRPDWSFLLSSRLAALNYDPDNSQAEIVRQHLEWGRSVEAAFPDEQVRGRLKQPAAPGSVLRIGYVSADFYQHSVYHFIAGVLFHHDRSRFEVYCYYNGAKQDDANRRLRNLGVQWRDVQALDDDLLCDLVGRDNIDILVDLSGHTQGNRLGVFARKAAPVQVTWMGYPQTTGLTRMDYRLTDRYFDPPDRDLGSEKIWRLPRSAICFLPPGNPKPVLESRLPRGSAMVFAAVNHFQKISRPTMTAWGKILSGEPRSRLRCYIQHGQSEAMRDLVLKRFAECGGNPAQVEIVPWATTDRFLEDLAEIDVALDPFPYNGGTTTNLCLWAGVPVLTLAGETPVARCGLSLLTALSLQEFVANDVGEYVEIGTVLAKNPDSVRARKQEIHDRYVNSAIYDHKGFTAELEDAYVQMWQMAQDEPSHGRPPKC